jgi:hypothetical protein
MRTWEVLKEPEEAGFYVVHPQPDPNKGHDLEHLPVGSLLCVEDDDKGAEILLVGDVNELGGVCDDCRERRPVVAVMLPEGATVSQWIRTLIREGRAAAGQP